MEVNRNERAPNPPVFSVEMIQRCTGCSEQNSRLIFTYLVESNAGYTAFTLPDPSKLLTASGYFSSLGYIVIIPPTIQSHQDKVVTVPLGVCRSERLDNLVSYMKGSDYIDTDSDAGSLIELL